MDLTLHLSMKDVKHIFLGKHKCCHLLSANFSKGMLKTTIFTIGTQTLELLTILVLKFEQVNLNTCIDVSKFKLPDEAKQCKPWSDATFCGIWSGSTLFAHLRPTDYLTFTTLWAFSADDRLMIFFLFFPENRIWHFMQIVSLGDNLHEMSYPVFWEK